MKRSDIITDAMEAEENWRDYLNTSITENKYSDAPLKEFYSVLSNDYAMKVGYTEDNTYRLTVFEILNGGTVSAEYSLLNDAVPIEFLYHYAIFIMESSPEKISDASLKTLGKTPVKRTFEQDHENLRYLWLKDQDFVERMILTRVISSYETYYEMVARAKEYLERFDEEKAYYRSIGEDPAKMGLDDAEVNVKENIEQHELIVKLIEILFDSGIKVYSPFELDEFVKSYLSNLVKKNEELLNPYVKSKLKNQVLPGELRIQAFMEASTGKDWVLPGC